MLRPGKGSRTGAKEAREASEALGACAGLGDRAAAIVRAHRHGLAQLGVLVTHLDQSGGFGALEHRRPGGRQLRRDGKLQQPCSQIAEQFFRRGGVYVRHFTQVRKSRVRRSRSPHHPAGGRGPGRTRVLV